MLIIRSESLVLLTLPSAISKRSQMTLLPTIHHVIVPLCNTASPHNIRAHSACLARSRVALSKTCGNLHCGLILNVDNAIFSGYGEVGMP